MLRMVAEAFCVLEERIVRAAGRTSTWPWCWAPGWPTSAAGVLKYACDLGLDRVLGELDGTDANSAAPRYCALPTAARSAAAPTPLSLCERAGSEGSACMMIARHDG